MATALAAALQPNFSETALRHAVGAVFGLFMTAGLFWAMQFLIEAADGELAEQQTRATLEFVRVKRDEEIRKAPPPVMDPPFPQPPIPSRPANLGDDQVTVDVGVLQATELPLGDGFGPQLFDGFGEGDYLPIVKVEPIYPTRALSRGIEGHCVIQFTVSRHGRVRDPFVVESQCTHALFRRASLDAVLKFRYRPRVIDGVTLDVPGVQNRFVFRITD